MTTCSSVDIGPLLKVYVTQMQLVHQKLHLSIRIQIGNVAYLRNTCVCTFHSKAIKDFDGIALYIWISKMFDNHMKVLIAFDNNSVNGPWSVCKYFKATSLFKCYTA